MIYSCFNQEKGLYDYFQDSTGKPINGDLPIPKLPPNTGNIGVPAIEAGRPMPKGAKSAGSGWHARGIVVNCRTAPLGAIDLSSSGPIAKVVAGSAIALGLVYLFARPARPATYAVALAAGGLVGYLISPKTTTA